MAVEEKPGALSHTPHDGANYNCSLAAHGRQWQVVVVAATEEE